MIKSSKSCKNHKEDKMSENSKKEPKLRFPGFTDAWEQRNVSELAEETYGGGTPKTSVEEYWTGDIPWIQSSDLVQDQVSDVIAKKYITADAVKSSATKLVPADSIAIVTRVGVGKLAYMPYEYATSQDFLSLSNLTVDHKFSIYAVYKKLQSELHAVQGTSIKGITKDELLSKKILVPKDKGEQEKIGAFFANLDHRITLHQRKLSDVQNLKAGLLQKMFPKNDANVPEIRFPGFTDVWEQRKFSDVVDVRSGRDYKHLNEGNVPVYGTGGYMLSVDEALSYDEDAIGIGRKGTIDKPYLLKAPFWTVDTLFYAVPNKGFNLDFVNSIFQRVNWKKYDESTGVPSLSKTVINKVPVIVPSEDEQVKIGTFFANLDHLITLHQRKLEHLQEQKKSLLQQMFV